MANSVDPDQMLHAASDQGLHCLLRPICPNIRVITVIMTQIKLFFRGLAFHVDQIWGLFPQGYLI